MAKRMVCDSGYSKEDAIREVASLWRKGYDARMQRVRTGPKGSKRHDYKVCWKRL